MSGDLMDLTADNVEAICLTGADRSAFAALGKGVPWSRGLMKVLSVGRARWDGREALLAFPPVAIVALPALFGRQSYVLIHRCKRQLHSVPVSELYYDRSRRTYSSSPVTCDACQMVGQVRDDEWVTL